MAKDLIIFRKEGMYCPQGDFYIDPWGKVPRALITHAHSDHARFGMDHYLCHKHSASVMRLRLGQGISIQTTDYQQTIDVNGVKISFHPAGHVPGSAQIRLEYQGQIWVASGDYKVEDDGVSPAFEPVPCHTFISESTFGLPVFDWKPQAQVMDEIVTWWKKCQAEKKIPVLFAYSLGKAQRLFHNLSPYGRVLLHTSIHEIQKALNQDGFPISSGEVVPAYNHSDLENAIIIAPPMAAQLSFFRQNFIETGSCSGWMAIRGFRNRAGGGKGFVLSDHADWRGLNEAIRACGASRVIATHGYTSIFARHLSEMGIQGEEAHTEFSSGITAEQELG